MSDQPQNGADDGWAKLMTQMRKDSGQEASGRRSPSCSQWFGKAVAPRFRFSFAVRCGAMPGQCIAVATNHAARLGLSGAGSAGASLRRCFTPQRSLAPSFHGRRNALPICQFHLEHLRSGLGHLQAIRTSRASAKASSRPSTFISRRSMSRESCPRWQPLSLT